MIGPDHCFRSEVEFPEAESRESKGVVIARSFISFHWTSPKQFPALEIALRLGKKPTVALLVTSSVATTTLLISNFIAIGLF
jgi:hypothetical protein